VLSADGGVPGWGLVQGPAEDPCAVAAVVSDVLPACGRAGAARSRFPMGLCCDAGGCRCLEGTLPAEAFVAVVKLEGDLITKGPRQAEQVIFSFLTAKALSIEFSEAQLKTLTSSSTCLRFATAGFGRLLSTCVVREVR